MCLERDMEISSSVIWLGANFGFAAVTTIIILAVYVKLVNKIIDIVSRNTEAFAKLDKTVEALSDRLEDRRS